MLVYKNNITDYYIRYIENSQTFLYYVLSVGDTYIFRITYIYNLSIFVFSFEKKKKTKNIERGGDDGNNNTHKAKMVNFLRLVKLSDKILSKHLTPHFFVGEKKNEFIIKQTPKIFVTHTHDFYKYT